MLAVPWRLVFVPQLIWFGSGACILCGAKQTLQCRDRIFQLSNLQLRLPAFFTKLVKNTI
ncbi:MAG: hypothetical protein DMG96_12365 [Acidobacteria bacterium]|nr:MAG: hypothetical protein DMG96_12365 [Acidobacteriota bacterium]